VIAFVALGGNLGDDAEILDRFRAALRHLTDLAYVEGIRMSRIYRSAPVGPVRDQPSFLNAVARIELGAQTSPEILLADLLAIEVSLGRVRDVRGGPRAIDLDLLLVGEERRATPNLTLPHPRMHERAFVLMPLSDLVDRDVWRLPVGDEPLGTLLDRVLLAADQSCDVAAVLEHDDDEPGEGQGQGGV
jgi:2-amino-4-hydroxy-6-hydroxymethyldihydropteridine diphosphokinase